MGICGFWILWLQNTMKCGWIQDMTFGTCLDIFELLSVSFAVDNYENSESFIQFHEKCSFFNFQCVSFSVYYFFGMSSYGLESSFFEKFIIWGIFQVFILLLYLSPLKSCCHFCDKITTVTLLWSRKSYVDPFYCNR